MSARAGTIAPLLALTACAVVCACSNESTPAGTAAGPGIAASAPPRVPASALIPGGGAPSIDPPNPYSGDAAAVRDGARLYAWYNCNGCHAGGGGGMGPPLMDDRWIYGSRPANLFDVIVEGRGGGMPAYGGKIPDDALWKIIAYIESMGGMQPNSGAASGESGAAAGQSGAALQQRQSQPQK